MGLKCLSAGLYIDHDRNATASKEFDKMAKAIGAWKVTYEVATFGGLFTEKHTKRFWTFKEARDFVNTLPSKKNKKGGY